MLLANLPQRAPARGGPGDPFVEELEFVDILQRTPLCVAARQNSIQIVDMVWSLAQHGKRGTGVFARE